MYSLAFSPDGGTLASGSADDTIRLWDVATGKGIAALRGHTSSVRSVAFSPDGKTLASASEDKTVRLWDAATGQNTAVLREHTDFVRSVAFSPDGKTLASASDDKTVRLWDVATRKSTATLNVEGSFAVSVAFSPDGKKLAWGCWNGKGTLWDVAAGRSTGTLQGHKGWLMQCVTFSPDGKTLAWASADLSTAAGQGEGEVGLWDVATGGRKATLGGHAGGVFVVAFSPDGKTLASGSADKTAKLWNVATGKNTETIAGHDNSIYSLAFRPDGKTLASGSGDKIIRLWDVPGAPTASGTAGGTPFKVEETSLAGMKLVLIPAGESTMGSEDGDSDERPPHRVRITRPFFLGQHEVTVGQFRAFVADSKYRTDAEKEGDDETWRSAFPSQTDEHPVVCVTWDDAVAFCQWLSRKEGKAYRLPTEAEWEYACRAGTQTRYSFGDDAKGLSEHAWFLANSLSQAHAVGGKKPNAWGLYDMHGNVSEWVADWYAGAYDGPSPRTDPPGAPSGTMRVMRGGSWLGRPPFQCSVSREGLPPTERKNLIGFRIARTP